jgi:biopolymer transport protein TolR
MMFQTGQKRSLMAEINVVPLVDVVLVLLIIFMVTAPLLYRGIDINLPRSSTNTIQPEERVVITVEKNQEVFIDKDRVTVDRVEPILETIKQRNPAVTVYLRADRDVPYGLVVQVMDAIKRVGIDKLGMVTEPTAEHRSP